MVIRTSVGFSETHALMQVSIRSRASSVAAKLTALF
jgi:hypothetical protein